MKKILLSLSLLGISFLGFNQSNIILPISKIELSDSLLINQVMINWTTIGEKGISHFEIEKSIDAIIFNKIGIVITKGGGSYSFIDGDIDGDIVFYRINTIELDGKYTYSTILKVILYNKLFTIYPNPLINDYINIIPDKYLYGNSYIKIFNIRGELVYNTNIYIPYYNLFKINTIHLPSGQYIIKIFSNNREYLNRFIKS